jgi:hypothetical protein
MVVCVKLDTPNFFIISVDVGLWHGLRHNLHILI